MKPQHKESELQIRCVKWFAYEYPYLRRMLYHPKNEGHAGGRVQGAIAKAEGVVAGVADLMLQILAGGYTCLAIEMKTKTGKQSKDQKLWQLYLTAAGGSYVVIRSYEQFVDVVGKYIASADKNVLTALQSVYRGQMQAEEDMARQQLRKILSA